MARSQAGDIKGHICVQGRLIQGWRDDNLEPVNGGGGEDVVQMRVDRRHGDNHQYGSGLRGEGADGVVMKEEAALPTPRLEPESTESRIHDGVLHTDRLRSRKLSSLRSRQRRVRRQSRKP